MIDQRKKKIYTSVRGALEAYGSRRLCEGPFTLDTRNEFNAHSHLNLVWGNAN